MATNKKVTHLGGDENRTPETPNDVWKATDESKGKAKKFRLFSILFWLGAIIAQIIAIRMLLKQQADVSMLWMIILILIDLGLVVFGSYFWKKSNRIDPPSEKNGLMFWMQSQLGLISAIIAFLPLVVVILTNKNISAKQKTILGSIAGVALLIGGITGYDFNPASVEKFTEKTNEVKEIQTGQENIVYWTEHGTKYHLSDSCSSINTKKTDEIFSGTVAKAHEINSGIDGLCKFCKNRSDKKMLEKVENINGSEKLEEEIKLLD